MESNTHVQSVFYSKWNCGYHIVFAPNYPNKQIWKNKSSSMMLDRHSNLKYKYGNRQLWCEGYYVDTVGINKKAL